MFSNVFKHQPPVKTGGGGGGNPSPPPKQNTCYRISVVWIFEGICITLVVCCGCTVCVSVFLNYWWLGWYRITYISLQDYSITRWGKTRSPKLKKWGRKLFQYYGNILPHHEWFRQLYESDIIKHSITGSRACMILPFRKNEYYGATCFTIHSKWIMPSWGCFIQHCFICRPLDSTAWVGDAGIKPRAQELIPRNRFRQPM